MSPLLKILIYTLNCAGKSSSICITARDDNDERAFRQTTIYFLHSIKFQKRLSLYEYVYVGAVFKSFQ